MNLPSSTTKDNAFGGERDGAIELIDDGTIFFTNDVEDMLDLTRMKSGVVNEDDINAIISKTTDLLKKNQKVKYGKCIPNTRIFGQIFEQKMV